MKKEEIMMKVTEGRNDPSNGDNVSLVLYTK
jgi:hypothetical protein